MRPSSTSTLSSCSGPCRSALFPCILGTERRAISAVRTSPMLLMLFVLLWPLLLWSLSRTKSWLNSTSAAAIGQQLAVLLELELMLLGLCLLYASLLLHDLLHARLLLLKLLCIHSCCHASARWQLILVLVRPMFHGVAHSTPAMLLMLMLILMLILPSYSMGNWKTYPATDFKPCQSIASDLFKACKSAPFFKIVIENLPSSNHLSRKESQLMEATMQTGQTESVVSSSG